MSLNMNNIVNTRSNIADRTYIEYTPLVNNLIQSKTRDYKQIEHMLDGLLGFCFDDRMLIFFKRLCRYYIDIDKAATIDYICYYKEMYEDIE